MADILNLPNWKVISTEENASSFYITAEIEGEPRLALIAGFSIDFNSSENGSKSSRFARRFKRTIIGSYPKVSLPRMWAHFLRISPAGG